jgi:D-glycero-D-manno-heptose 1,7-bisphosphate phosphatase
LNIAKQDMPHYNGVEHKKRGRAMKLLVLDKDGTITKTRSGQTFVRHPQDQELIPGVAEAIAQYIADGWTIAIASNQGGVAKQKAVVSDLLVGQHVWKGAHYLGQVSLVESTLVHTSDGGGFRYAPDEKVSVAWKTLGDAIAEMRYCLRLIKDAGFDSSNTIAYFCPDDGDTCGIVKGGTNYFPYRERDHHLKASSYRKPFPGMIEAAMMEHKPMFSDFDQALMVGDRLEDEQAAANAGVTFMWANEWRENSRSIKGNEG